jgi:hypothetical protein
MIRRPVSVHAIACPCNGNLQSVRASKRKITYQIKKNELALLTLKDLRIKQTEKLMIATLFLTPIFAAAGWSLLYLLCGGGLGGAILLFIVLKMFGK